MKINYHGHSCFTVVLENGASLLLDPYNGSVGYPLVERKACLLYTSFSIFPFVKKCCK